MVAIAYQSSMSVRFSYCVNCFNGNEDSNRTVMVVSSEYTVLTDLEPILCNSKALEKLNYHVELTEPSYNLAKGSFCIISDVNVTITGSKDHGSTVVCDHKAGGAGIAFVVLLYHFVSVTGVLTRIKVAIAIHKACRSRYMGEQMQSSLFFRKERQLANSDSFYGSCNNFREPLLQDN